MCKKLLLHATILTVLSSVVSIRAVSFSKDTISAFDVLFWSQGYGDDSILISNDSNQPVTLDSLRFEFDDPFYSSGYQIGWEEISGQERIVRVFNSDDKPQTEDEYPNDYRAIALSAYNSADGEKIVLDAGKNVTIRSPYIGKDYSIVGIYLECDGVYEDGRYCACGCYQSTFTALNGKIIFVSDEKCDTLFLKGQREIITSVIRHNQSKVNNTRSFQTGAFNLLGRTIHPESNPAVINLIRKTDGTSIVNPLRIPDRK
ncbi:MAG: hypothetical protein GX556_17230 [Fibrobacter sp.]|nr:hypothetical protein [Fibrobacter sp.]